MERSVYQYLTALHSKTVWEAKGRVAMGSCSSPLNLSIYTLSEAWSGVNWAELMAAQGAFGTDFDDTSIL